MMNKLFLEAATKFISGVVLVGLLLFLPAGTVTYWNGWLLMGVLFIPVFLLGMILMVKNPALLKKRLESKERDKEQSLVVRLSGLMFLMGFIVAGLGVRFDWYRLPDGIAICAAAVFLIGYLLYIEVLRENSYLSRTVEIQENQQVIDTGLYRIVRHPMYGATLLMFCSIPLILGSIESFLIFLAYPFLLIRRIENEERLLEKELSGYQAYQKKVKYRLIPFLW